MSHHHHGGSDRQLARVAALNVVITLAQMMGGLISRSRALLSGALHNIGDVLARRRPIDQPSTLRAYGWMTTARYSDPCRVQIIALFQTLDNVHFCICGSCNDAINGDYSFCS